MHSPPRQVALVAGSGRSGTSTMAGVLRRAGFHVPQPEVIADASNPRGFAEPRWLVDTHQQMLRRAGVWPRDARPVAWEACASVAADPAVRRRLGHWLEGQLASHPRVVLKDPRLTWFAQAWAAVAEECGARPAFVTMLRPPTEVFGSVKEHYGSTAGPTHLLAQWLNVMLGTERATRGQPRAWIQYHDLLADPLATLVTVRDAAGLAMPVTAEQERAVTDFVDPGLRRSSLDWDDLAVPQPLRELAQATWTELVRLTPRGADPGPDDLDACRQRFEQMYAEAESMTFSTANAGRRQGVESRSTRTRLGQVRGRFGRAMSSTMRGRTR